MGSLTCHFQSGQCPESSRTPVRSGSSALTVFKLTATLTPNRRENKAGNLTIKTLCQRAKQQLPAVHQNKEH